MKNLLIISLVFNVLLVAVFLYRKYIQNGKSAYIAKNELIYDVKAEIQQSFLIDSGDVVFIGNSITESFPLQEYFKSTSVKNRGVAGNWIQHIYKRIPGITRYKPAKIFLQAGINDILNNEPFETICYSLSKTVMLIRSESPATKIYVQTIFPASGKFSIRQDMIKKVNEYINTFCAENNVALIDLYSKFLPFEQFTYDGVHLNKKGYDLWFECVKEIAKPDY